jgi:hypothetical protein
VREQVLLDEIRQSDMQRSKFARLFDHLIGDGEQRRRHLDPPPWLSSCAPTAPRSAPARRPIRRAS